MDWGGKLGRWWWCAAGAGEAWGREEEEEEVTVAMVMVQAGGQRGEGSWGHREEGEIKMGRRRGSEAGAGERREMEKQKGHWKICMTMLQNKFESWDNWRIEGEGGRGDKLKPG